MEEGQLRIKIRSVNEGFKHGGFGVDFRKTKLYIFVCVF
jgi:hypothetical protein